MKPIRRLARRECLVTPADSRQNVARFKRFVSSALRRLDAGKPTFIFVYLEENPGRRTRRQNATAISGPPYHNPSEEY